MADTSTSSPSDGIKGWKRQWDENDIGWHQSKVHKMLQKHISSLIGEEKRKSVFIPLCGKTVDMKWLSDKGHTVVGLDGVIKCLEDFCVEQGLEWTAEGASKMGPGCQVLKVKERQLNLYCGDVFRFNASIEGQFDCIWDRGSIVALNRNDVKAYATLVKDLLKPGGKLLVEVFEYDVNLYEGNPKYPPPFPVFEDEMKSLFEQDCTLEKIDRDSRKLGEYDVDMVYYLLVKK